MHCFGKSKFKNYTVFLLPRITEEIIIRPVIKKRQSAIFPTFFEPYCSYHKDYILIMKRTFSKCLSLNTSTYYNPTET